MKALAPLYVAKFVQVRAMGKTMTRFVIAVWNMDGFDPLTKKKVPSFAARFRLVETGTYPKNHCDVETAMRHLGDRLKALRIDPERIQYH